MNATSSNNKPKIIKSRLGLKAYNESRRPRTSRIAPMTAKAITKRNSMRALLI